MTQLARLPRRTLTKVSLVTLALALLSVAAPRGQEDAGSLGPPPLYTTLVEDEVQPAGHIKDQRFTVDRFEFALTDGDLYVLAPNAGQPAIAVFLGDGVVTAYPPDGVEHQQLEKFLDDDDSIEEPFDRLVFWLTGDVGARLLSLADDTLGRDADDAQDVLEDRRDALLEHERKNPDARVMVDLLSMDDTNPGPLPRSFFLADVDTDDHGWVSIEIEPHEREEVTMTRLDRRRNITDVWMAFHALSDFDDTVQATAFDGFPRDPETAGKIDTGNDDDDEDDWNARDLGLALRPRIPDHEGWTRQATISRSDIDLALSGSGTATASAAVVVEPLESLTTLRLRIASSLKVTDVRVQVTMPDDVADVRNSTLLRGQSHDADEPVSLTGEPVHYVQAIHRRRLDEDIHEPWVTVVLPRRFARGERFVVELAYEGELLEYLNDGKTYVLKDALNWLPRHVHARGTSGGRTNLTYRVPERFRVASGSTLVDEHVIDGTRVMRWVSDDPVTSMSFNFGRFNVTEAEYDGPTDITVYEDRTRRGFAPGNRAKTLGDLTGALNVYTDYFVP
jgi:hypothetical protein